MAEAEQDQGGLHGYYEWQMQTLMLAHDLASPIARGDEQSVERRREQVEQELNQMVHDLLPQEIKDDPRRDFPPELIMQITRATLRRAAEVAGVC